MSAICKHVRFWIRCIIKDRNFTNRLLRTRRVLVDEKKYTLLTETFQRLISYFGSTYLCESNFPSMNLLKSKFRSRITNEHLNDCMNLAITWYIPEYNEIRTFKGWFHFSWNIFVSFNCTDVWIRYIPVILFILCSIMYI